MTHISTQFNLEAMPLDAYLQLMRNLSDSEMAGLIADLNFGWMFDHDDTIYDDRNATAERFVPAFADHFDKYRRLHYIAKQIKPAMRANLLAVWNALYPKMEQEVRFKRHLEMLHNLEAEYRQEHAQFGGEFRLKVPMLDRFKVKNMGSWGASTLAQAIEPAERILRDGSVILHRHWERTGWRFGLRHPLAMGGATMTDSLYLRRQPINLPLTYYLGSARTMVYDLIRNIEPTTWSEEAIQGQFNRWMDVSATATFTNGTQSQWVLTPIGMPAPLILPTHTLLPVVVDEKPTPSLDDRWQCVQQLSVSDVIDGTMYDTWGIPSAILRLGWLMAMAATILSLNLKVGSGQEKLRWIHSFPNAAHIGEAMTLAPMILHQANEVTQ